MMLGAFKRLSNVGVWLSGLTTMAMMVHITADVAFKYIFNWPIQGTLEIVSAYYMVAAVFLPIAVVELYQASISVDTVYQYLPRSLQFFCMVVVLLGSAVLYLTLAWTSWGDAVRAFQVGEMMMGTVPVSIWPSRFVMPLSLALAGAVCVWHLTRLLRSQDARDELMAVRGPKEEAAEGQR